MPRFLSIDFFRKYKIPAKPSLLYTVGCNYAKKATATSYSKLASYHLPPCFVLFLTLLSAFCTFHFAVVAGFAFCFGTARIRWMGSRAFPPASLLCKQNRILQFKMEHHLGFDDGTKQSIHTFIYLQIVIQLLRVGFQKLLKLFSLGIQNM